MCLEAAETREPVPLHKNPAEDSFWQRERQAGALLPARSSLERAVGYSPIIDINDFERGL